MTATAMRYLPCIKERFLEELLATWEVDQPRMGVLVLLPEAERDAIARVQQACALFPALIEGGAFRTAGAWLLRLDEMPYAMLHPNLPREAEKIPAAMDAIAANLGPHLNNHHDVTLFLLFDAMVPNIATLLDELYLRLANRVHYMGVNAGSETFRPMPCLFDGSRTVQDGVLAILMKPHPGAVLEHGYSAPPQMLTATSTEGNRIVHIDWRPAFEVYQELARAHYGVEIDRENFYRYAVHFPFGVVRANGMTLVRIPVALEEDGSLFCVGEVPPNAILTLLEAPAVDSAHTLDALVQGLAALDGPPAGQELLLFYCAGRRLHLGIEAARHNRRVAIVCLALKGFKNVNDTLGHEAGDLFIKTVAERGDDYQYYSAEMTASAAERLAMENDLRNAFERGEFLLHYQPQTSLTSGAITGVEALVRWWHPRLGVLPPALRVAVNLSTRQFSQPDFDKTIGRVLAETGLAPHRLLELTESILIQEPQAVADTLARLARHGVQISIDDFGTGYPSLAYLKRLPIDALKIDCGFVRDITTDPDDAAIVGTIITWRTRSASEPLPRGWKRRRSRTSCAARAATRCRATISAALCPPTASPACCGTAGARPRARGRAMRQCNPGTPITMRQGL